MNPQLSVEVCQAPSFALYWVCETAPGQFRRVLAVPVEAPLAEALVRLAPAGEEEQARAVFGELAERIAGQSAAALSRDRRLEVHLPFLNRKQWARRWEALARTEIELGEDGRLLVSTAGARDYLENKPAYQSTLALAGGLLAAAAGSAALEFTLSYSDRRRLAACSPHLDGLLRAYGLEGSAREGLQAQTVAPDQALEVSLTLGVPGHLVRAWLAAPCQSDPEFFHTYAAVSLAVQRALRRWAPYLYLSDANRYDDLLAAWPLLVFEALPLFPCAPKYQFTRDVVDLGDPLLTRRATLRGLTVLLARLHPWLVALGKHKTARFFAPGEAPAILKTVARQPRLLNSLLSAETFVFDALLDLGLRGHAFTQTAAAHRERALKELSRFVGDFLAAFHRRLRRLYGSHDFVGLGALLLLETTRALCAARGQDAPLRAVLRVRAGQLERTFVSPAD